MNFVDLFDLLNLHLDMMYLLVFHVIIDQVNLLLMVHVVHIHCRLPNNIKNEKLN